MSSYGLIKATSRIQRADSIEDLRRINAYRIINGQETVIPESQSVRQIENAVAKAINFNDHNTPVLVRGISFYQSILKEI